MAGTAIPNQHYRYVPTLRTKTGEAGALRYLPAASKARIFPVFQITERPPGGFLTALQQAWNSPLALDGLHNYATSGTTHAFQTMFSDIVQLGISVVPCVEVAAAAPYLAAVQGLLQTHGPELVVRTTLGTLGTTHTWVQQQGWSPSDVHLLIDAGHVAEFDPAAYSAFVLSSIQSYVNPLLWRSVTLSASAAPKDASALQLGPNTVERRDWMLWQAVAPQVDFQLDYGDYGCVHRDLADPPGFAMAGATVSVKYADDTEWLIRKGRRTSGATGVPMNVQYQSHAQALIAHPCFGHVANCWADQRIQQIASGATSAGSRATWVPISMNRHLALVAERLP